MAIILGIDAGGTYTDAVIIDMDTQNILAKAKALTTHSQLEIGIANSIDALGKNSTDKLSRVILSTTLATNAIVEKKGQSVGAILIGHDIQESLPCKKKGCIRGAIDYRGNVTEHINGTQLFQLAAEMAPFVDVFVISGVMSARNPQLEQGAKTILSSLAKPIYCAHEISSSLGYYQRTVTTILNAQVMDVMRRFIESVIAVLKARQINTPIYIVKSDGSLMLPECAVEKPIETMFSGPAASIEGAIFLSGRDNCIVIDIGGTTSDIGFVRDKQVPFSEDGARIASWHTHVKSLDLTTIGLGGDSKIEYRDGTISAGPERVLPSCRSNGPANFTPTDILHCTGEYIQWNRRNSLLALTQKSKAANLPADVFLNRSENCVLQKIKDEFPLLLATPEMPVVAVGAPARTWLQKAAALYNFPLVIPDNFEVANAIGAAISSIHRTLEALIRFNTCACSYILYCPQEEPTYYASKDLALHAACKTLKRKAAEILKIQKISNSETSFTITDKEIPSCNSNQAIYIETRIQLTITSQP
ncbi:MAG: hydantoinase/oxoprolinase family protein [Clostridiales Family XIII bacterium]|nr:hydantoinase/oxoprolinase family protein [Clostridia bacterium]MDY3010115.1 hydantoinase/oxoprolinase family protein [Clostridiales Family XIII bacterium]